MNLPDISYPALYQTASAASASSQKRYLWLIRIEYILLMAAAIFAMDLSKEPAYFASYAVVFLLSLIVLLFRSLSKPEQVWYKSRALAESIKTSTWRYVMRAGPFDDAEDIKIPRANFRNTLRSILDANRHVGEHAGRLSGDEQQITIEMDTIRLASLAERVEYYDIHRIREQRIWYSRKAGINRRSFNIWLGISVLTYVVAGTLAVMRIAFSTWTLWPIDPLIVAASATIGWIQVKKFSELSVSYILTAHEIGIMQGRIAEMNEEEKFSEFINEAELAFSREHTQWVARQQQ